MQKRTVYPIHVEVEFQAEDEVELTAFINYLMRFDFHKGIHIRRIVPLSWLKHGVPEEEYRRTLEQGNGKKDEEEVP